MEEAEGLCVWCRNFDGLIPDAPELIHTYLEGEQDASCKRNAFMMLIHVDRVSFDAASGCILSTNCLSCRREPWITSLPVLIKLTSSMIFFNWLLWS